MSFIFENLSNLPDSLPVLVTYNCPIPFIVGECTVMDLPLSQQCSDSEEESYTISSPGTAVSDDYAIADRTGMGIEMFDASDGLSDDEMVPECPVRQESFEGVHGPQQLVHCIPPRPSLPLHGLLYDLQRISCTRDVLVETYRECRKLLGTNVKMAHAHWQKFITGGNENRVLIACVLSFSVVSNAETTPYLKEHWDALWWQMDHDSPDYQIARFMAQYALAWAQPSQELPKAFHKVVTCYKDMEKESPDNFFLAPFYTVTIGRWIYEDCAKEQKLSVSVIEKVLNYADETLRLIGTLEDDWARIDTFGVKLSALNLLMLAEDYLNRLVRYRTFCRKLRRRIDRLYKIEICQELSQNYSQIVVYEQAWFHSVSATYYLKKARNAEVSLEEKDRLKSFSQLHLAQAAHLYFINGRFWRAIQEAKRAGDPEMVCKYSAQGRNAPAICP